MPIGEFTLYVCLSGSNEIEYHFLNSDKMPHEKNYIPIEEFACRSSLKGTISKECGKLKNKPEEFVIYRINEIINNSVQ